MSKSITSLLKTNPFVTENLSFGAPNAKHNDDYTICGAASTISAAKWIIREIPLLLERHGIKTILDMPCGDYNWMRKVKFLNDVTYIGADYDESLIEINKTRYPDVDFRVIDVLSDPIPTVDLVFCRDLFTHLPFEDTKTAIANIKASGAKYLLTTSFSWRSFAPRDISRPKQSKMAPWTPETTVQWTRLNLFMEPFNFPPCIDFIVEFNQERDSPNNEQNIGFGDKILGLWDCNSL